MKNGSMRGRISDGSPNPVDLHVGARLKARRMLMGLSQSKLAKSLGLTFQQIQKYEKGLTRIGASRLYDLANVLGVSVQYFFEDISESAQKMSPRKIAEVSENVLQEESKKFEGDVFSQKETMALIRAYYSIPNRAVAHEILQLLKKLSDTNDEE